MNNIFVGILTCNRKNFYTNLVNSLKGIDCTLFTVDDSYPYEGDEIIKDSFIKTSGHKGCAYGKNLIMKRFLESKCDYLFIIEDDMIIVDKDIFNKYIEIHNKTKIHHLMFALHGHTNRKIENGIIFPNNIGIVGEDILLFRDCCGSMCFYTRRCLEDVGLMDENFFNAFEHVEHTYRLSLKKYCPPFWTFPDIKDSHKYVWEQDTTANSVIRPDPDFHNYMYNGLLIFKDKHGIGIPEIKTPTRDDLIKYLADINELF